MNNIACPLPLPIKPELPVIHKKDARQNATVLPFERLFEQTLVSSQQQGADTGSTELQSGSDKQDSQLGQEFTNGILLALVATPPTVISNDAQAIFNDPTVFVTKMHPSVLNLETSDGSLALLHEMQQSSFTTDSSRLTSSALQMFMSDKVSTFDTVETEESALSLPLHTINAKHQETADHLAAKTELQSKLAFVSTISNPGYPVAATLLASQQKMPVETTPLAVEQVELSPTLLLEKAPTPDEAAISIKTQPESVLLVTTDELPVSNQPIMPFARQEKADAKQSAEIQFSSLPPIQSQAFLSQPGQGDKDFTTPDDSLSHLGLAQLRTSDPDQPVPVFETIKQTSVPNYQDIIKQIVDQARLYLRPANQSEMVLQLKPEHLGELTLRVSVDSGVVSAAFHSDNPEVRQVIEASLPQLKQDLSQQGIKLDNVSVFSGTAQFFDHGQRSAQQQQSVPIRKSRQDLVQAIESAEEITINATEGVDYRI